MFIFRDYCESPCLVTGKFILCIFWLTLAGRKVLDLSVFEGGKVETHCLGVSLNKAIYDKVKSPSVQ